MKFFNTEDYLLEVYLTNNNDFNGKDLVLAELYSSEIGELVTKHNAIVFEMENLKGEQFFKAMNEIDEIYLEVDAKLIAVNALIMAA